MKDAHKWLLAAVSALVTTLGTGAAHAYGLGDFLGAVPAGVRAARSGASLSGGVLSQHYSEHLPNGAVFDSEHGTLHHLSFALQGQGSHFGFQATLRAARGTTNYVGALQTINSNGSVTVTPATSTTDNQILNMQVSLDEGFSPLKHLAILPSVFVGRQHWKRQIRGVGGYNEQYNSAFYGAGLAVVYQLPEHLVLSAGHNVGRTSGASMQADLSAYGAGEPTFDLGDKTWRTDDARITWLVPHHTLAVYVDYRLTRFGYGQSPYINGFMEPDSTTQWNTVSLGIMKVL
ncbi:MAG: hypothetical protein P8124_13825 [Gammaproteobacteria bacterium]